LDEETQSNLSEENIVNEESKEIPQSSLIDETVKFISEAPKESFQQPNPPAVPADLQAITGKLRQLEQWVGKISMAGPGSGEVRLKYLDDIDRSSIGENKHLAYNAATDTFFFETVTSSEPQVKSNWTETDTNSVAFILNKPVLANVAISGDYNDLANTPVLANVAISGDYNDLANTPVLANVAISGDYADLSNTPTISSIVLIDDGYTTNIADNTISVVNLPANTAIGPIEQLSFNTNHTHQEERVPGTLCWDPSDNTLNLTHPNDVVQQIGQESYMLIRNKTGNTILNGEVIRFAGAEMNGTARMLGAQFLADGTYPSLYLVGIATSDIAANTDGFVTVTGKVRDLNTTGNTVGETWYSGNILYANPTIPGALTRNKPTAPNNVVPMAAVLRVHETEGEIFVRPTIEQEQSYGRFSVTSDVSVSATNTANVVYFDTVDISRGVIRVAENHSQLQVQESGLYQIDISAQVDATGGGFSSGTMFMWIRVNGEDRPNSTRRQGVLGSAPSQNIGYAVVMSLNYNDIVQLAYAGDSTALRFDSATATAFCPSTASVKVGITQIQL